MSVQNINALLFFTEPATADDQKASGRCCGTLSNIDELIGNNCMTNFVRRICPFCLSCWMWADIALDIHQTRAYLRYGYGHNNGYQSWARNIYRETGYLHTISKWYFSVASAVWAFSPILFTLFLLYNNIRPGKHHRYHAVFGGMAYVLKGLGYDAIYHAKCNISRHWTILLFLIVLPINLLGSTLYVYIIIPLSALFLGIKRLIAGGDGGRFFNVDADELSGLMIFELFGEALPQVILSITYVANNYDYVHMTDKLFGNQTIPTSVVSIVFSIGSIVRGIVSGRKAFKGKFG